MNFNLILSGPNETHHARTGVVRGLFLLPLEDYEVVLGKMATNSGKYFLEFEINYEIFSQWKTGGSQGKP